MDAGAIWGAEEGWVPAGACLGLRSFVISALWRFSAISEEKLDCVLTRKPKP